MSGSFESEYQRFAQRLSLVVTSLLTLTAAVVGLVGLSRPRPLDYAAPSALIVAVGLAAVVLHLRGRPRLGAGIILTTVYALTCLTPIYFQDVVAETIASFLTMTVFSAFLIAPRAGVIFAGLGALALLLANVTFLLSGDTENPSVSNGVVGAATTLILGVTVFLIARQSRRTLEAHRRRLLHNRTLFEQLPEAVAALEAAAGELALIAGRQQEGALHQASAVEETRSTLDSLLASSQHIAAATQSTLESSDRALANALGLAGSIHQLAEQTARIAAISQSIKTLASKSDLLALNAALEGTKAGEAGRGFSLVAAQMQTLAEGITRAVAQIKGLTADIDQARQSTTASTGEATALAQRTNEAARKISLVAQQQRSSVEQVAAAVDDISQINAEVVSSSAEVNGSSETLQTLSRQIAALVDDFKAIID